MYQHKYIQTFWKFRYSQDYKSNSIVTALIELELSDDLKMKLCKYLNLAGECNQYSFRDLIIKIKRLVNGDDILKEHSVEILKRYLDTRRRLTKR